jgi:hypothetical protein
MLLSGGIGGNDCPCGVLLPSIVMSALQIETSKCTVEILDEIMLLINRVMAHFQFWTLPRWWTRDRGSSSARNTLVDAAGVCRTVEILSVTCGSTTRWASGDRWDMAGLARRHISMRMGITRRRKELRAIWLLGVEYG